MLKRHFDINSKPWDLTVAGWFWVVYAFPEAVPIVIGGGTSLVKGFLDVFNEQFDQDEFPIPISEIVHIEDAHTAVARGCLSEAQLIEEDDEE